MKSTEKNITLLAQDMSDLSPRQRTVKMKKGKTKYLYSLLDAGVVVDFVEYLLGTIEEMEKQRVTRIRQLRFQRAYRARCQKSYTRCRVCSRRLVRKCGDEVVETSTNDFARAFCRGPRCRAKMTAHRVVKLRGVPQPVLPPPTPIDHRDLLSDDLTMNRDGVKKMHRIPKERARTVRRKAPISMRGVVQGAIFAMVPGKAGVTQPPPPAPIQRRTTSPKAASQFSFGKLEREDIRE